jgi:hypothetical protein
VTTALNSPGGCCPVTLGEVCWDTGVTSGMAFAVFDPVAGTTSFIDQLTGAAVAPANIVACPTWGTAQPAVTRVVSSAAGSVAAGMAGVTITNVGAAAGTVAGVAIAAGETVSWNAYSDPVTQNFNRLPAIAYNGTGTTLSIATQA